MINPRILMLTPLLFLGSCVPITPMIDVIVITGHEKEPRVRTSNDTFHQVETTLREQPSKAIKEVCTKLELAEARAYQLPQRPNLSHIDPEDDHAVVDAILNDNERLRNEISRLQLMYICTLESK